MEPRVSTSQPSTNPPSVEIAYKRKCIALKKRLSEIEAENELMRVRNQRGWHYIQKMRLESCILLERLATITGMTEEAQQEGASPELRARAAALVSNTSSLNGVAATRNGSGPGYYEDETEGSSDEQPPTPQERPLRVKRSRKSNINLDDDDMPGGTTPEPAGTSSTWPRLAPAPSQEEMTSTFRIQQGNGSGAEKDTPNPSDRESQFREVSRERADAAAENSATPMDLDAKEPKEES